MTPSRRQVKIREHDRQTRSGVWLAVIFSLAALVIAVTGTVAALASIGAVEKAERKARADERRASSITIRDIKRAEFASCRRVQILRLQSNGQARVIYLTLTAAARSARERPGAQSFAGFYRVLADTVTFTPPTDCDKAITDPYGYEPPEPIAFGKCRKPPPADFAGCPRRKP